MQKLIPETLFLLLIFSSFLLSGCGAISNEGKVDFRRTNGLQKFKKVENVHQEETGEECKKNNGNPQKDCEKNSKGTKKGMQTFAIKNFSLGKDATFIKGDSLSLHLRTAYIRYFSENMLAPYVTKIGTRQWGKDNGEIAIVANAFEEVNGRELSFENMREGRVVFYSHDVNKDQALNFNNMSIYGPITYQGAPFVFRIAIFELDVVSEQAKAMLNTIAQAGGRAYPPASPILDILNGIGSSFLDGDQTDTEFRYTMVLDHKGGSEQINHFNLEAGNYVLIRIEDRNEFVPWDELVLDENEGIVYWNVDKDGDGKLDPYRDDSYLVVEINKNVSDVQVDLAENNFTSLMSTLEEKDKQKASKLQDIPKVLFAKAVQREQIKNFGRAKEIIGDLMNSEVSWFEKRIEAKELFEMIGNSLNEAGEILEVDISKKSETFDLSEGQVKYVLKKIRAISNERINASNWQAFDLDKVFLGFKGKLNPNNKLRMIDAGSQKTILDLIAPVKKSPS